MECALVGLALVAAAALSALSAFRRPKSGSGSVRLVFEDCEGDTARIVVWGVNQYGQRVTRGWNTCGRSTALGGWWWRIDSCLVVEGYDAAEAKAPAWIRTLIVEGAAGETTHFDNAGNTIGKTTGATGRPAAPSRDEDHRA